MTVVGSVEYDVLGVIDPAKFDKSIDTPLNRAAARAGDRFGTVLGKAVALAARPFAARAGDDIGQEITKRGRSHGLTFGKLVGAGITAGLGVSGISAGFDAVFRGLTGTLHAADDLAAAGVRTRDTFGAASAQVSAFAEDQRRNLLLTKTAALENSAIFGDMFKGAGVASPEAARLSVSLVGVAENLAAIKHQDIGRVLTALQGGIEGNINPVRQLGVDLSTGRVQAEAFALGLAKPTKDAGKIASAQLAITAATANLSKVQREHGTGTLAEAEAQDRLSKAQDALAKSTAGSNTPLSAQQLLQARAALILRDTANSTGGAARSTDDYTVASQHLHKQLGDIATTIGTAALPRVTELTHQASTLVDEFVAGKGTGGELRDTLSGLGDDARDVGDVLQATVLPVIRFFADHPTAFKAAAEGMALYAASSKIAAVWNARLAVSVPAVAVGEAAVAAESVGAATGVAAVGGAAQLAVPQVAALTAALVVAYKLWKQIKGLAIDTPHTPSDFDQNDPNLAPFAPNTGGMRFGDGSFVADSDPTKGLGDLATAKNDNADRSGKRAAASAQAASKASADAAKKAQDEAKAQKYAADQLAAYQERQHAAVQAAEDAARARGEATTKALQAQSDVIKKQVDVLSAYGAKISDFRRGIFAGTTQFTALTGLVSDPSRATATAIVGSLQSRVLAEKLFAKNLATLGQRGLDKGVLAELAQAGPENRAFASALAQGSPEQIRALNAAERASRAQAQALAGQATDTQFGVGAVAKNQAALAEQNRRLAHIEQLLGAQPGLIAKAVDQAGKNVKVAQKTGTRTAVAR